MTEYLQQKTKDSGLSTLQAFPSPVAPDRNGSLRFPPSFAPDRYQPRTSGRMQVWNTDPKSRVRHPDRGAPAGRRAVRADRCPWRNNFRGVADVEITLDGHVIRMRGQLLDDVATVALLYARAIDHFGLKRAQRILGLKIYAPGTPGTGALSEAARRSRLSAIWLTART